jgi:hypothetical protein
MEKIIQEDILLPIMKQVSIIVKETTKENKAKA